jgi:Spy/CpxP family protein refolding chaperone
MKIKTLAPLAAVAVVVTLALAAGAGARQGRGGPPPFGPPSPERMLARLAEDLSLSDDQVAQIKTIMTDEQTKTESYRAKLGDLDEQMRTATANGQFDEAKVREIASQQAAVMVELTVERERGKSKTYSVLTPEQRTTFDSMRPPGPPPGGARMGFAHDR